MTKRGSDDRLATIASLAGLAAPVVYGATVVVGGMATPGYSQLTNAISELTMAGASRRLPLAVAFVIYNLLVAGFALTLPRLLHGADKRAAAIGAMLLIVVALAGFGMTALFPTDRPGDPFTSAGSIHLALAAVASLGTMTAILAVAWSVKQMPGWRGFAAFSFACLAAIVVSGGWAAVTAARLSPLMGLAERVTIGTFMVWLFMLAAEIFRRSRSIVSG